jgi:formylglycine-generating enzyme required for sulfatase activity
MVLALLTAGTCVARAEHRHALVIGNGTYPQAELAAPATDVRLVGDALERRGFVVTRAENLDAQKMGAAINAFAGSIPNRGTALVYFSGYAVPYPPAKPADPQVANPEADTVLLPLNGRPDNEQHLRGVNLDTRDVLAQLATGVIRQGKEPPRQSGSGLNILLVDGCHPHPARHKDSPAGLVASGTTIPESLVIYAAPFGRFLEPPGDGPSPLAKQLVAELDSPKPLDAILATLGQARQATVEPADLAVLASPASATICPPTELRPGTRAGEEWIDRQGAVYCWCPPGRFTIGSPPDEPGRDADEIRADVEIPEGFWIGKHEFTRRELLQTTGGMYESTGNHKLHPLNWFHFDAPSALPGIVAKLNEAAPPGWAYAVPTEAEWEYAARAGTATAYSCGDDPAALARFGNFADRALRESGAWGERAKAWPSKRENASNFGDRQAGLFSYAHKSWSDGQAEMARVGCYPANPWGLHDVHGNIAECTWTPFSRRWTPPADLNLKEDVRGLVARGGSWLSLPASCRSAFRGWSRVAENCNGVRFVLRRVAGERKAAADRWTSLVPTGFTSTAGCTATIAADGTVLVAGREPGRDLTYTLEAVVPPGIEPRAIRIEALNDPALPQGGPGRNGRCVVSEVAVRCGPAGAGTTAVPVAALEAVIEPPGQTPTDLIDGSLEPRTGWIVAANAGKDQSAVIRFVPPSRTAADGAIWRYPSSGSPLLLPAAGGRLAVDLVHPGGASLGKFRLAVLDEPPDGSATRQTAAEGKP